MDISVNMYKEKTFGYLGNFNTFSSQLWTIKLRSVYICSNSSLVRFSLHVQLIYVWKLYSCRITFYGLTTLKKEDTPVLMVIINCRCIQLVL